MSKISEKRTRFSGIWCTASETTKMSARLPTLFIPHGGGPCFFMEPVRGPKDTWDKMAAYLRGLAGTIGETPKAILVISGHWETEKPTVNSGANPPLLFDYYNFPEHTYRLTYPAPGAPELAKKVQGLLAAAGFESDEDATRGFDHGIFIPFLLVYPDAQIPIVQLSMQQDLDPKLHFEIGRALAPLRDEGVLIVGSGMSFHNLRAFLGDDRSSDEASQRFDDWLTAAVAIEDAGARSQALAGWEQAPFGRLCHPREEHLLPLMVAAGAAGEDPGRRTYSDRVWGKALSAFQFG
jgi:aromatic ring-opening dioxygenase catalytic subunit (LigB family)